MAVARESSVEARSVWAVDPSHTLIEPSVRHMMFTTVKGRLRVLRGTIVTEDLDPRRSSVEVEIDAASIETGDPKRDAHLRSPDFLDVERFPTMTFKSTRVEPAEDGRLRVYGDLTIRGTTREVVLDAVMTGRGKNPYGQEVAGFAAETTISRRDFGMVWNVALETGGVLVSDEVRVAIELEAVRQ